MIGPPQKDVLKAMKDEHGSDEQHPNLPEGTTPRREWRYVTEQAVGEGERPVT